MFPDMECFCGIKGVFAVEQASYSSRCMLGFVWTLRYELLCKPYKTAFVSDLHVTSFASYGLVGVRHCTLLSS
jgi:hypothetical protein